MKKINIFVLSGFSLLILRLIYLQVISEEKYKLLAKRNCVKAKILRARRGKIYDRNGVIVATDKISYWVKKDNEVEKNASFKRIAFYEEHIDSFPVDIEIRPHRWYPFSYVFSHPVGYVGEVSREELQPPYILGDVIGKMGIERFYEEFLRGKRGYSYVIVDATGKEIAPYPEYIPPSAGKDLVLTIDSRLQRFAYNLIDRGVIVAASPRTGEILCYISKPSFNPNSVSVYIRDTLFAMWDRVACGTYSPGSVFKIITAACALEEGIADENTKVFCSGAMKIGRRYFKCWSTHGEVDFYNAIVKSCDVFFYKLGLKIGFDELTKFARKMGFGKKVGIDLPYEGSGFIPDRSFYREKYGRRVWKGDVANLSIGQGEILCTPLQLLQFFCAIANNGKTKRLHLVKKVKSGNRIFCSINVQDYELPLSESTIQFLKSAMEGAVDKPYGTGHLAYIPGLSVCGKTGTAENPLGKPHALFCAFAPRDSAEIAVVVVVEHGGMGGVKAAPIAREVIREYFRLKEELPAWEQSFSR